MASVLNSLLILGIDETWKAKLRVALAGVSHSADIVVEKATKSAYSVCVTRMPDVILIEWKVFPIEDLTVFFQKLRKHRLGRHVPVVIVAEQATPQVLSVAAEYDVFRVVSDLGSPARVKSLVRSIGVEGLPPSAFRERADEIQKLSQGDDDATLLAKAEDLYRQFPDIPQARFEYANACLRAGKLDEARELARKALVQSPNNLRANNILARVHLLSHEFDKALDVLQKADGASPRNVDRLLMMGDAYIATRRTAEARRSYETALRVEPGSADAAAGLVAANSEGELNEILGVLREARSREERASLFNTAGVIAARRKDFEQANALYQTALDFLDANDLKAKVLFNLALAYERARKLGEALVTHQKVLELEPGFEKSRTRLALLAGSHVPAPLPQGDDDLEFDDLEYPVETKTPSLVEMVSQEKVLQPFPVKVIKPK